MAWFRIVLTEQEQQVVRQESQSHECAAVRGRMLALWLLHCGLRREEAARGAQMSRATLMRVVAAFRDHGLEGLRRWDRKGPLSALVASRTVILASLQEQPPRTVAQAADRIEQLTGLRRGPTQVRKFLRDQGLTWRRTRAIPVPPKKVSGNRSTSRMSFCAAS